MDPLRDKPGMLRPGAGKNVMRAFFVRDVAVTLTTTGMFAMAVSQLVLIEGEQDAVRVNHHARALLNRATPAAQSTPWTLWKAAKPAIQEEEDRRPDQASLHRYRVGYQTVGQSFSLWPPPAKGDQTVPEDAQRVGQNQLHRFRTTYQTVGQPYALWPKAQQRFDEDGYSQTKPVDLTQFRSTQAAVVGQPWYLWKKQALPEQSDVIVLGALAVANPQALAVAQPGQPWYLWPVAKADQAVEPDATRADHSQRLLFGKQAAAASPGQPFFLWPPRKPTVEAEDYTVPKPSHLVLTRVTTPTVTQQWFVYKPTVSDQTVEDDPFRVDQQKTHRYRSVAVTVTGAPWYLWPKVKSDQTVEPDADRTDHAKRLFFGRTTTAVPGAPWYLWRPQVRHTEPEGYEVPKPSNFALTRVTTSAVAQWFFYKPTAIDQAAEDDPARLDQQKLHRYRSAPAPANPGQPWYMWPSAKADQSTEPNPRVTDHAGALYPFLPHPAIEPPADATPNKAAHWPRKHRYEYDDETIEEKRKPEPIPAEPEPRFPVKPIQSKQELQQAIRQLAEQTAATARLITERAEKAKAHAERAQAEATKAEKKTAKKVKAAKATQADELAREIEDENAIAIAAAMRLLR